MDVITKTFGFDGDDEIIYSHSFNIYENKLIIPDFLGFKFTFIFQKNEPEQNQKDVTTDNGKDKEIIVTLSSKFRNNLGSMTTSKIPILGAHDNKGQVLFSIFGQSIGEEGLHIVINFYARKI